MINALIYLIVFLAIQAGVSFGVQGIWRMATGSTDITATMIIVSTVVYGALTAAVFLLARWCEVSRGYVRSRPWGVVFWCVMASVGAVIPSMWLQEQLPELPDMMKGSFDMVLKDRWGYVAVGLMAPMVEEIVFRGAILRALLHKTARPWVAIILSAVFFAVAHFNPVQMPHAFLVGLLLDWMYCRTDSIVPGVVYHWVNNSVAYVLYNVLPDPDITLSRLFGDSPSRVLSAVLFSLCILLPALFQLNLRMRKAR